MISTKLNHLISLSFISLLVGCSNHQQIVPHSISFANAQSDFRLTRPVSLPQASQTHQEKRKKQQGRVIAKSLNQVLGMGDKIMINVHSSEEFSGIFTIDLDGFIKLPYINPIFAQGLSIKTLGETIKDTLIVEQIFQPEFLNITIAPAQWSAAYINIKGAVYKPGSTLINERDFSQEDQRTPSMSGDFAIKRLLSNALKAAGGLRPDADISNIAIVRGGQEYRYDLSGLLSGQPVLYDPILVNGDQVVVPSVGYLQKDLFQLSRVTPPGYRVFLSNLTAPSTSNNSSGIGKYSSSMPLGSRLLTAAMSANCVGGTMSVNANRVIVLAGKNIKTNLVQVTQKNISELLTHPNSDQVNPYLLPNDHVACFDTSVTDWRDIGRAISDILSPLKILSGG